MIGEIIWLDSSFLYIEYLLVYLQIGDATASFLKKEEKAKCYLQLI